MTIQVAKESDLPGVNVLVMGPGGTGKTTSLGTLVDYGAKHGIEVFCVFTESGRESLLGYWTDKGKPVPDNLYWTDIRAAQLGFAELMGVANDALTLMPELLHKKADPHKAKYTAFVDMLRSLSNFKDERTGKEFGDVSKWGTNRALAIDSLTGVSAFAMQNITGGKIVRDQGQWGQAQTLLEFFLNKLTDGTRCHTVMLAHVERETDMIAGGVKLMPSTLGKALPPKLSKMYSDVVLAERNGDKFQWTTNSPLADTKSRNLGMGVFAQDFGQILDKWQSRGGVIEA